jgi:hypothetical protein
VTCIRLVAGINLRAYEQITFSREACQLTVGFQVFDCCKKGSLQDDVVWTDRAVEFADVTMVSFDVLGMFSG